MKVQIFGFGIGLTLALLAACTGMQKPGDRIESVVETRARIIAVDQSRRLMTLRGALGEEFVVQAGDAVKNFDQVKAGDEVVVAYTRALVWQVKPAGEGTPGVTVDDGVTTAGSGATPAATAASSVTVTATITAINLSAGTVTLTEPGGNSRVITARDPGNLRNVKVGDLVDITFSEALAVSVKPVNQ